MPWQRQFKPDVALTAVMELFWSRGYAATSVQDIVQHTGVNRASLYATFGDKRSLFLAALKRYDHIHRERWFSALVDELGGVGAIREAFEQAAGTPGDGCMLVNTTLELAPRDPEIAGFVDAAFSTTRDFFEQELAHAGLDQPATRASALLSLFLGLRVLARTSTSPEVRGAILSQVQVLTS